MTLLGNAKQVEMGQNQKSKYRIRVTKLEKARKYNLPALSAVRGAGSWDWSQRLRFTLSILSRYSRKQCECYVGMERVGLIWATLTIQGIADTENGQVKKRVKATVNKRKKE